MTTTTEEMGHDFDSLRLSYNEAVTRGEEVPDDVYIWAAKLYYETSSLRDMKPVTDTVYAFVEDLVDVMTAETEETVKKLGRDLLESGLPSATWHEFYTGMDRNRIAKEASDVVEWGWVSEVATRLGVQARDLYPDVDTEWGNQLIGIDNEFMASVQECRDIVQCAGYAEQIRGVIKDLIDDEVDIVSVMPWGGGTLLVVADTGLRALGVVVEIDSLTCPESLPSIVTTFEISRESLPAFETLDTSPSS